MARNILDTEPTHCKYNFPAVRQAIKLVPVKQMRVSMKNKSTRIQSSIWVTRILSYGPSTLECIRLILFIKGIVLSCFELVYPIWFLLSAPRGMWRR